MTKCNILLSFLTCNTAFFIRGTSPSRSNYFCRIIKDAKFMEHFSHPYSTNSSHNLLDFHILILILCYKMSQCQCIASSTGEQCRNNVKKGSNSPFCHLHQKLGTAVIRPPFSLVDMPRQMFNAMPSPPASSHVPPFSLGNMRRQIW